MRIVVGLILSFFIGFACRWFDLPAPAPPEIFGVLLVVAMTIGYIAAGSVARKKTGGQAPTAAAQQARPESR